MEERVVCVLGNGVGIHNADARSNHDLYLGSELVADPSNADGPDTLDALHGLQYRSDLVHERRVDGIHEPQVHVARRA